MRSYNAIALALSGWYLVIPTSTLPPSVAYKESLPRWQIVRGFDTADACEDFLTTFFEQSREKQSLNILETVLSRLHVCKVRR